MNHFIINSGKDLNNYIVDDASQDSGTPGFEYNPCAHSTNISVYFKNIEQELITKINEADAVFGAVAWMTNPKIISAISRKRASIIVQKEDFLRPDMEDKGDWKANLRKSYDKINGFDRFEIGGLVANLSYCGDPSIEGVRCVGNHNSDKNPAFPRMHNKFMVFAKMVDSDKSEFIPKVVEPYAVWTGSFNFTANATNSLENAVYITDPKIVSAFFVEFSKIVALSEPLDWTSNWCAPEWRIGS